MINVGFGDSDFSLAVYIANKPPMLEYQSLPSVIPLVEGEIDVINKACGNGWRKVFNVYAKILYELDNAHFPFSSRAETWQKYRDNYLLQDKCKLALLFSPPELTPSTKIVHIICGKGYSKALVDSGRLVANLVWLDEEFAIDLQNRLIVCPYFDYRQLSNIKIDRLACLLKRLQNG